MLNTLKKLTAHPPWLRRALLVSLALIAWTFFLWRGLGVFKPGPIACAPMNSDSAVPVLMANEQRPLTIFNFYYYGTDRWGAWALVAAHTAGRLTGHWWTAQSLSELQTVWIFIGALVLAGLSRRDRVLVGLAFLLTLCLQDKTRYHIFTLSQLYGWQTSALLLGWYGLRRLFDNELEPGRRPRLMRGVWASFSFLFSFLAVWSSVASVPFLLLLLCLEVLRARLKGGERFAGRRLIRLTLLGLVLVLSAALAERLQKMNYHRHAQKHYGFDFRTRFELDTGFLKQNLGKHLDNIVEMGWWPLHLLATVAAVTLVSVVAYALLKKRHRLLEKLCDIFRDDTAVLAAGAYGIALINFVLTVLVSHVRLNDYDRRFLTLTSLFGPISAILTLYLIARWAAAPARLRPYVKPAFIVAGVILLLTLFPTGWGYPEYEPYKETAAALASKAPRGILIGGYWETYVFAGLQPRDSQMTPVPLEGQENRMPWTRELVRRAESVVVEYRRGKLGQDGQPPERLTQYGNQLRLADPKFYENGELAFALYVSESR